MLATHQIIKLLSKLKNFNITVLTGTLNPERVPNVRYAVDPYLKLVEKKAVLGLVAH